jgi:4-amino-4-deoxy-L-arabinose transferase-like glycosyltransferase
VLTNVQPWNRIIWLLTLAALLGLAVWLRVRFIHTVHLYPDEFVTLLAIKMVGQTGAPVLPSGLFYEHGLLYSYVGALAAWFGPPQIAARYASLVVGILTLGLTFWLARRWFSVAAGLAAVAGLAVAPAAIEWSSRARMYALLQLLVLLTLWLAYEGIAQNSPLKRRLALLTFLAATLAHFGAVALAPPLALAVAVGWWLQRKNFALRFRQLWPEAAAFLIILLIAFLIKRAGQPKGIDPIDAANAVSGIGQVFAIYSDFSLNLIGGWESISPFYVSLPAVLFAPFALIAAVMSVKRASVGENQRISELANSECSDRHRSANNESPPPLREASLWGCTPAPLLSYSPAFFLSLILFTATLEMILMVSPHRRDEKYLFMLLPVLFLLGAQGIVTLSSKFLGLRAELIKPNPQPATRNTQHAVRSTQFSLIVVLLSSGLTLTIAAPAVKARLANTGDDYAAAFAYVQNHWQPGDAILTGTPAAAAFYLGYNDFYSVQRAGGYDYRILTVNGQAVDRWLASPALRTPAELTDAFARQRVWLVLEQWGLQREYYDPPFQQQLLAQTDLLHETQGMFVLRSKPNPRPVALKPAHPAAALLGDQVWLTGYTVDPPAPVPGQSMRLTFYWQATAPMPHNYTVFVHLRQPGGGNVAQADRRPLGSVFPTTLWPVGETIRETGELTLPADLPPGPYELWTGLYRLDTLERLPVQNDTSGENAVRLGELEIKD